MKKLIVLLVLVMVFLPSFSNNGVLDKFFNVSIEKLQKNPEEYRNKEIKIKGSEAMVTSWTGTLILKKFACKWKMVHAHKHIFNYLNSF